MVGAELGVLPAPSLSLGCFGALGALFHIFEVHFAWLKWEQSCQVGRIQGSHVFESA